MTRLRGLLMPALLLAWAGPAAAHTRGTSYSDWQLDPPTATVRVRVSQLELTRLQLDPAQTPDYGARIGALLATNLQLWSRTGRCPAGPVQAAVLPDGWVAANWTLQCPDSLDFTVRSTLLLDVAPGHLHFARLQHGMSAPVERVLTYAEPAFTAAVSEVALASFPRYLQLGMEHILSGWDHICFVLALVLLAPRLRDVALIATGFTVAHSLTLAAAITGWADAGGTAVEAVIGYSIMIVTAENLWARAGHERWVPAVLVAALLLPPLLGRALVPIAVLAGLALFTACYFALARQAARPLRLRIAVAFIFGLVHGFGFAGALTPLNLPADRLAVGLLGFNLGVEFGQLLVIACAWVLLQVLARTPPVRTWAADSASAVICGLGTFWFVTRAFG